ncbi:MAG: hypothetical protein GXP28_11205 [Planctomycetes bacterium]|nr:hypothetical protein [Planctomycetota bacterium]
MRRLMTFFLGMVTGGALLFGAMNYHLIRAHDGVHFIPKVAPKLRAAYVDIRGFTVADWAQHSDITAALIRAEKGDLMKSATSEALQGKIDQLLNRNERK